jgi:hypothetical protein
MSYSKFTQSVKDAISNDGGANVFENFGINTDITKNQLSPFSEEKNPSFSIRYYDKTNRYSFKDFSNGNNLQGDCITFIQSLHNSTFTDALNIIAEIYGIESYTKSERKFITPKIKRKSPTKPKKQEVKALLEYVNYRDFEQKDFDYFQKKTGLDLSEFLPKYCQPIASFKYENGRENKIEFLYQLSNGKLYAPEKNLFGKQKNGYFKKSENYRNLGFNELDFSRKIFPCEGFCDFLVMKSEGLNVMDFEGVANDLPKYFVTKAKEENFELSNLVLVSGQTATLRLCKKYGCLFVDIPKISGTKEQNDISDYTQKYGFDADLQNALFNPEKLFIPRSKTHRPIILPKYIKAKDFTFLDYNRKYLSNENFVNADLESLFTIYGRIFLSAIAGTGKTEYLLQYAKKFKLRLLMVLPYTSLTHQQKVRNNATEKIDFLENELREMVKNFPEISKNENDILSLENPYYQNAISDFERKTSPKYIQKLGFRNLENYRQNEVKNLKSELEICRKNAIENLKEEYAQSIQKAKDFETICIDGTSSKEEIERAKTAEFVAVCYDSLHKVAPYFDSSDTIFCVDECHNIVTASDYRSTTLNEIVDISKKYDNQVWMSATQSYSLFDLLSNDFKGSFHLVLAQTTTDHCQ